MGGRVEGLRRSTSALLLLLSVLGVACAGGPSPRATAVQRHTVTGSPEKGLPYRLHLPREASAARRARLVVWLHPSTGPENERVEALADALALRGFALLVPTHRPRARGWGHEDLGALLSSTLPEVGFRADVDATAPVLLGHGAGADQALSLWLNEPCRFGAVVVSGAWPLLAGRRRDEVLGLPDSCIARTPVLAFVGELAHAARAWRKRAPVWREAGVQLTLRQVPRRGIDGNEWLLRDDEAQRLLHWLQALPVVPPPSGGQL